MSDLKADKNLLTAFENGLNPRSPEESAIPANVLGYGEISTVLAIGEGDLAYKRLPIFETEEEVANYEALHMEYVHTLAEPIGLTVAASETVHLKTDKGRHVLYIVQERFPSELIGHKVIHHLSPDGVSQLVTSVLRETNRVFSFNRQHRGELEFGIDGQTSNWAVTAGYEPGTSRLGRESTLTFFDTSTPLVQKGGVEQLDPELFLRNAPSFLAWVIRLLFLEDVMTRYYDFRKVATDLVANFHKEQRSDVVPDLVDTVNKFLSEQAGDDDYEPLTVEEVQAYYREDAWIWRLYLFARKIDRSLHRLLHKDYPYILPGKITR